MLATTTYDSGQARSAMTLVRCAHNYSACKTFALREDGSLFEPKPFRAGKLGQLIDANCVELSEPVRTALCPTNIIAMQRTLNELRHEARLYVVRGEPAEPSNLDALYRRTHKRSKTGEFPTLQMAPRSWVIFDFDGLQEHGTHLSDPEAAIRTVVSRYIPELRGAEVAWRYSARAFMTPGLRLHVVAFMEEPAPDEAVRNFLKLINERAGRTIVDDRLAITSQPFYSSSPRFIGDAVDPVKDRSWHLLAV